MTVGQDIKLAPHRWKANALTTASNPASLNDHKNIMIRMLKQKYRADPLFAKAQG